MKLNKIIKEFEKIYPIELAYDWDNVGLLIGDKNKEINKILVSLDITEDTIQEAILKGVDAIFSHHPMIFSKLKKIRKGKFIENKVYEAIRNDICIYAAHTNLDIARDGLNDYFISLLDFKYKKIDLETLDAIRIIELEEELSVYDIAKSLKNILKLDSLRLVNANNKIKKIAVVTGSGDSFIDYAIEKGVDLLITGDLKHHISLDTYEKNMSLIDVEHFGSEKIVVDLLYSKLSMITDNNVSIIKSDMKKVFETI